MGSDTEINNEDLMEVEDELTEAQRPSKTDGEIEDDYNNLELPPIVWTGFP